MNLSTLFFMSFISTNINTKFSIDFKVNCDIIDFVRFIDNKIKTKGGI